MVLESFDFLSPTITLYYYGKNKHSSSEGGILTIIMVLSCIIYISYIISELFLHKSPTSQYYRKYLPEAGYFPFDNKEGIFHYFQLYNSQNENLIGNFDTKYIRIFMFHNFNNYQDNPSILSEKDHWVYDKCEENDFSSSDLIDNEIENYIEKSICIKYFYNSTLKKYFSTNDKRNFISPYLIHGSSNVNNLFLSTIIEKCQNNSITSKILGSCESEEQINKYLKINLGITILILNHQVDTSNFFNPISSFTSRITNDLSSENIPVNNINIAPLQIKTHSGFLTENTKNEEISTYTYEENRKTTEQNSVISKVLCIYYYWLQNDAQIYERKYQNLINDMIPRIGGVVQLVYYLFYFVNKVLHKFNTIRDTRNLIFEWNRTLEDVNNDRNNFSRIVKSLQDTMPCNIKNDLKIRRNFTSSLNLVDTYSRMNYSRKNGLIMNRVHNNSLFGREKTFDNPKNKKSILRVNESNIMSHFKINENPRNSKNAINQFNSNAELNLEKPLDLGKNLVLYNNRRVSNFSLEPKSLTIYNSDQIENNEKRSGENDINNDNKYIPISNILMNIDKNTYNIFDKNYKKNNLINKRKRNSNNYIDEYKLESTKIALFNNNISFSEYISAKLCCLKKSQNLIYVLEQFRKKLLSEEHFFKINIFLCLAEKYLPFNRIEKKIDIVELYENL